MKVAAKRNELLDTEFSEELTTNLILARRSGDTVRRRRAEESIIIACLPRAASVARKSRRRGADVDDIEQVARLGVIKAVRAWDPGKGPLLSYLMPTINGEVKRYFRDKGTPIRIPRSLYESNPKVTSAERDLCQRLSREPTVAETARASGVPASVVRQVRLMSATSRPLSTDESAEWMSELTSYSAEQAMESCTLRAVLRPAIRALSARERRIIALRFVWGQSQAQIATALGVSQMHISRLQSAALTKLRVLLAQQGTLAGAA
jgi:RNA polymerase sigma-B factor